MLKKTRTAAVFFLLVSHGLPSRAWCQQEREDFWPATLMENAWGVPQGRTHFFTGLEFEEDSGDFPTTKIGLRIVHGVTDKLFLQASSQLVRFNLGDYTAWGGAETMLGLQYRLLRSRGAGPAVQFKGNLVAPTGGLSASEWSANGGLDLSWQKSNWGFHLNGQHTVGSANEKALGVSEADRWRVAAGVDRSAFPAEGWTWTMAVVGAKPIRPKPNEWTFELGIHAPLSSRWSANVGWAQGLRERGVDWLLRFGFALGL